MWQLGITRLGEEQRGDRGGVVGCERVRVGRGLRAGTRGGWRRLSIKEVVGGGVRVGVLNRGGIALREGEHGSMSLFQGSFETGCDDESCFVLQR
jgi:hypothetical protein